MPKGAYDASASYEVLDLVTHKGNVWVAKRNVAGVEPSEANSADWFLMADLANYLPKNDAVATTFTIEQDGMIGIPCIRYRNGGTMLGYLGIRRDGQLAMWDGSAQNMKTYIHDGNVGDYALPKSGGTVGTASRTPLQIWNTAEVVSYLMFKGVNTELGGLGMHDVNNPVFYPTDGSGAKTLFHTGNKPSGTYTGNGSATARSIVTGGIGSACMVAGNGYISFGVAGNGGFGVKLSTGEVIGHGTGLYVDGNGNIAVSSEHQALNESGKEYRYFIL